MHEAGAASQRRSALWSHRHPDKALPHSRVGRRWRPLWLHHASWQRSNRGGTLTSTSWHTHKETFYLYSGVAMHFFSTLFYTLSFQLARTYFRQIVRAISYCHRLHVVHRDLKPENVVFFEKLGTVKLTDFGFSNRFCPGQKLETSCGSLAYSAPEILLGDSYDAPAVG